jgi:glycosyltransferase involved in cell wall biosynthesis
MKVSFVTTSHKPEDDRIYFHQAVSLADNGHKVEIISTKSDVVKKEGNISFNCFNDTDYSKKDKVKTIVRILKDSNPDVIICSEPLAVHSANKFRKEADTNCKIIYDITEWYPSKKNLSGYNLVKRFFMFPILLAFNMNMSAKCDGFIFGEWYKSKPYKFIFPRKKHIYISYYPDLKYLNFEEPGFAGNQLRLMYSGKLTQEKGYKNFLDVIEELTRTRPELQIHTKVIGWYASRKEQEIFEKQISETAKNVTFTFYPVLPFEDYIHEIRDTDIFLDLRSNDPENSHCLPIKLFYFAALKRPVIYSDLKAIRKEVEINKFGFLVDPSDVKETTRHIINYLDKKEMYLEHCNNARSLVEKKYNWNIIKNDFMQFLEQIKDDIK